MTVALPLRAQSLLAAHELFDADIYTERLGACRVLILQRLVDARLIQAAAMARMGAFVIAMVVMMMFCAHQVSAQGPVLAPAGAPTNAPEFAPEAAPVYAPATAPLAYAPETSPTPTPPVVPGTPAAPAPGDAATTPAPSPIQSGAARNVAASISGGAVAVVGLAAVLLF